MNTKLLTERELRNQMRSTFAAVFPDRSTDGLEDAMSGSPKPMATDHQKKEWILEKAKMSLLAEDKIAPAKDPLALQNVVAQIDDMVASISIDYTDEDFYQAVREKYGSRAVQQAKRDIDKLDPSPDMHLSPAAHLQYRHLMMEMWMDGKESACEKYTPKKYRK